MWEGQNTKKMGLKYAFIYTSASALTSVELQSCNKCWNMAVKWKPEWQFPPLLRAKAGPFSCKTLKAMLQLPVCYHQDGGYDD